ncbi:hypothetical protein C7E19_09195 [Stenotrophomonas maltophilia]|nr:hypothetical protein C7E19_09195 [Stenotrophomonas maltophilia]
MLDSLESGGRRVPWIFPIEKLLDDLALNSIGNTIGCICRVQSWSHRRKCRKGDLYDLLRRLLYYTLENTALADAIIARKGNVAHARVTERMLNLSKVHTVVSFLVLWGKRQQAQRRGLAWMLLPLLPCCGF